MTSDIRAVPSAAYQAVVQVIGGRQVGVSYVQN